MDIYTVKAGDSLSTIARDVLGDLSRWPELARLNLLSQPYTIFPGQVLSMPVSPAGSSSAIVAASPGGLTKRKRYMILGGALFIGGLLWISRDG